MFAKGDGGQNVREGMFAKGDGGKNVREGMFAKGDGGQNVREGMFAKGDGGQNVREGMFAKGDLRGHRTLALLDFTKLYHCSTWLYLSLLYTVDLLHSTIVLLDST